MKDNNNLRMTLKSALDNLWSRITGIFTGLDDRVTALEQGGGGGEENVIEAISFNGVNVPPDANKNVALVESDPTVPSWAKQSTKPSYTAAEVGALPDTTRFVSGVKGNEESSYRSGNVNLTPANIGAAAADTHRYAMYNSVEQLGLTSGRAMIGDAWYAMPDSSVLITDAGNFANSEIPSVYGTVVIVRKTRGRCYIYFHGKRESDGDYRMYFEESNPPTGVWRRIYDGSTVVPTTAGGTGAATILGAVQNLFDAGNKAITEYPNKPGIYRVTSDIFNNMNPVNRYGLLVIFKGGYGMHLFLDAATNLYIGYSGDTFNEPTTWKKVTSTTQS